METSEERITMNMLSRATWAENGEPTPAHTGQGPREVENHVGLGDPRRQFLRQEVVGAWVRRLRGEQSISLRALAARAGFSPSFISQVENGVVSPSLASMERICYALGTTLGECFANACRGEGDLIVRATERVRLATSWTKAQVDALAPMAGVRLEPLLITLEAGGHSAAHASARAAEEFVFVLMGRPTLTIGEEQHELRAGDAVTIRARELRRWENRTAAPVKILNLSVR
jgi:transcriptional regulator with XRE-family HTH domain